MLQQLVAKSSEQMFNANTYHHLHSQISYCVLIICGSLFSVLWLCKTKIPQCSLSVMKL